MIKNFELPDTIQRELLEVQLKTVREEIKRTIKYNLAYELGCYKKAFRYLVEQCELLEHCQYDNLDSMGLLNTNDLGTHI